MVPNLKGPVIDTHRPQSAAKKVQHAKGQGIWKDKKRPMVEFDAQADSFRSKANGLDVL